MPFGGNTYDRDRDGDRLRGLLAKVRALMDDGQWRTIPQIQQACGGTEASCSARLRDLRKQEFGGYSVERQYVNQGVWRYRLCGESEANDE